MNWIFANKSNGCPKNASILLLSEQKAGKSLVLYSMVLEMQRRDKAAGLPPDKRRHALIYNTELRGALQHDVFPEIDKDYMTIYDTKLPAEIFDRVENDIKPMVQDGMPLGILGLDSLTNIQGIKRGDAESVTDHLRGDHALTVQTGLDKMVPFCKQNKILLVGTSQLRANQKAAPGGPDSQMAEGWLVKHTFEYFISMKRANAADDKTDLEGKSFEDDGMKDARDNKLITGHKIYAKCEANSIGPQGRSAVFTMDYAKGIVNQHEEVFFLGKNTGVIKLQGQTYSFGGHSIRGQAAFANLIKENPELYKAILEEVRKLDEK
jgi:hypothetical protein